MFSLQIPTFDNCVHQTGNCYADKPSVIPVWEWKHTTPRCYDGFVAFKGLVVFLFGNETGVGRKVNIHSTTGQSEIQLRWPGTTLLASLRIRLGILFKLALIAHKKIHEQTLTKLLKHRIFCEGIASGWTWYLPTHFWAKSCHGSFKRAACLKDLL